MTAKDLLKYIKTYPDKTIMEIAHANRSTFYEVHGIMAQLEEKSLVVSTMTNGSSANQRVVWRANGNH